MESDCLCENTVCQTEWKIGGTDGERIAIGIGVKYIVKHKVKLPFFLLF